MSSSLVHNSTLLFGMLYLLYQHVNLDRPKLLSPLDWGTQICINSLLNGILDGQIRSLQRLQNNSARIACNIMKYDHITPSVQKHHWLPVRSKVKFKTVLLTYKSFNVKGPAYIAELFTPYFSGQSLSDLVISTCLKYLN